jgi:Protein of unknown function (DUF3618)
MADPDGAAVVQGAVAKRGAAAARSDPNALVAEIERTRENLARTIDTLADRVSPANGARQLRSRLDEQAARPDVRLAAAAVGFALVSLIAYRMFVRRRR